MRNLAMRYWSAISFIQPMRYPADCKLPRWMRCRPETVLGHARWMLENLPADPAKAWRWLCFVQGVLWCLGYYSVDELRTHTTEALKAADETDTTG